MEIMICGTFVCVRNRYHINRNTAIPTPIPRRVWYVYQLDLFATSTCQVTL